VQNTAKHFNDCQSWLSYVKCLKLFFNKEVLQYCSVTDMLLQRGANTVA